MSRLPFIVVIGVIVLLLVAVSVQNSRPTPSAPAALVPAAAPTATPTATATATPVPPTIMPTIAASVPRDVPDSCPITRPQNPPFVPPAPWPAKAPFGEFWYGTADLWTPLGPDGTWRYTSQNKGPYPQKIFLWKVGYSVQAELQPKITITGRRLDASLPPYMSSGGTNACHSDFGGCVMLWGVDLPSLGCWQLTVEHAGHELSFVVWVAA